MVANRIRHTVTFSLVHEPGSAEERDFLQAAEHLASIPGVEAFELLAEVSPKSGYRYGISMEFRRSLRVRALQRASRSRSLRPRALAVRGERLPRARLRGAIVRRFRAPLPFVRVSAVEACVAQLPECAGMSLDGDRVAV